MFNNYYWWTDDDNKTTYGNEGSLYFTSKISNVTIEPYFAQDIKYDKSHTYIYNVPADIENVIFKVD